MLLRLFQAKALPIIRNKGGYHPPVQKTAPFLVKLERNQVYNRLFIETLGFYLWTMVFARSRYELLENAIDFTGWCAIGVGMPLVLDAFLRKRFNKNLAQQFKHLLPPSATKTLLELPYECLDNTFKHKGYDFSADKMSYLTSLVKQMGFSSAEEVRQLLSDNPKLKAQVRNNKLWMLGVDLFFMCLKGQLSQWGGKWLTEKLSGKKGFSGEFAYANDAYLNEQADKEAKARKKRQLLSIGWGLTGVLGLPLLMKKVLNASAHKGAIGKLKRIFPAFNYMDAIFMSKWVIFWHNIFNWAAPNLLSVRDKHEFRERLSKVIGFDLFYFIGDDLFNGLAAKWLSKNAPASVKQLGPLWETHKLGPFSYQPVLD